jgi:hypothetical protein
MHEFKKTKTIKEMTNAELIEYKHFLETYSLMIKDHLDEFKEVWNYILAEIKSRLEDLQYDLLEAEDLRENCDLNQCDAQTRIH